MSLPFSHVVSCELHCTIVFCLFSRPINYYVPSLARHDCNDTYSCSVAQSCVCDACCILQWHFYHVGPMIDQSGVQLQQQQGANQ
jgi:hypothetical protein